MVSVAEAFDDPKWVERAIRLQLRHGDPVVPLRVYRAMSAILKGPLNFPPVLARWIVDKFAPENGVVLDPCAGYGGRLLGAVSSRRNITYVGYDVEPKTVEGNQKLAKHLEVSSRAGVELLGVEAVPEYPKADLVMTSPPYYNAEYYGSCAEITLQKYTSIREWLDGFLRVLIRKSLAAAPLFLLNIGAVKDCDLPEEAVRLATEEGFKLKARWTWQTATFGNVASKERLLLFER
jgi:DNA modification methylase